MGWGFRRPQKTGPLPVYVSALSGSLTEKPRLLHTPPQPQTCPCHLPAASALSQGPRHPLGVPHVASTQGDRTERRYLFRPLLGVGPFRIFRLPVVSTLLPEGRAEALKGRCRKRLGGREEPGQVCPQPVSSCLYQMLACQNFWGPEPQHGGEEGGTGCGRSQVRPWRAQG